MPNLQAQRGYDDESGDLDFQPLTAAQAQTLREKKPAVSPWRVLGWQCLAGGLTALAAWGVSAQAVAAQSALYGASVVILPAALFLRAISAKPVGQNVLVLALRVVLWESVKLVLTLVLLALAPRLIENLNWLAMMAGLVVTLKIYWLALLWRSKPKQI